jgi:hypothetical protein
MKRLHPSLPAGTAAPTPAGEVNERYLQHPATGSFAVQTEGEITRWDTFAAHRSSGNKRTGSRNEVAAPPRRRPRDVVVRRIGAGTKGTQGR